MNRLLFFVLSLCLLTISCSKSKTEAVAPAKEEVTPTDNPGVNIGSTENEEEIPTRDFDDEEEEIPTRDFDDEEEELPTRDVVEDQTEDQTEEEIDVSMIGPNDPCYKYMNDTVARPVANCKQMKNGRLSSSYDEVVKSGSICLLKSTYNNGITIFTAEGNFTQVDDDWNQTLFALYGFKEAVVKNDQLEFKYKDDNFKTTITYDLVFDSLKIKQVTKRFKKKIRYFKLACTPVYPIR